MPETAPVHLSNSARLVASALAESEQSTVTALANAARVSKSTVAKTLALLECSGAAIRTVREDDGIREADLWSPGRALGALLVPAAAGAPDYVHTEMLAPATETTVEPHSSDASADGDPVGELGGRTAAALAPGQVAAECPEPPSSPAEGVGAESGVEHGPDQAAASLTASSAAAGAVVNTPCASGESTTPGGRARLAAGELAAMVAAKLAAHPDIEYTPAMLSHMLGGRSSGAIHNVLVKMVQAGAAVRTSDRPKRYRYVTPPVSNGS